ncbi:SRPBCC family protein [Streptomyces pseudovenezuelae]|uniref:hypothetical protein n=1 Tax=Streptomyces pseudovenezuelae TaxID=67350 RepID=UPI0036E277CE
MRSRRGRPDPPPRTVWKLQADVERRPVRQPPVVTAERLDPGRLAKGARFRWATPAPATPTTVGAGLRIAEGRVPARP